MSSLRPQDRKSLCRFTFADGRQCRTPRAEKHPHFCRFHARKESRARSADKLARELAYFFSGEYLSACDLSSALGRLLPAVVRGDIKPRSARTLAYLSQTLVQTIHLAQDEYINALGTDSWRSAVRNSVHQNFDHLQPSPPPGPPPELPESPRPQPQPQPVEPPLNCHSERSEESAFSESQADSSQTTLAPRPGPSAHTPLPPTRTEFIQHVLAGRNLSRSDRETGEKSSIP